MCPSSHLHVVLIRRFTADGRHPSTSLGRAARAGSLVGHNRKAQLSTTTVVTMHDCGQRERLDLWREVIFRCVEMVVRGVIARLGDVHSWLEVCAWSAVHRQRWCLAGATHQ